VNKHFNIPIPSFNATRSLRATDRIMCTALVFQGNKLLLLQRSPHTFAPNFWEPPGGTTEVEDTTLLNTVTRELYEETGLVASSIHCSIGTTSNNGNEGIAFRDVENDILWLRFLFEVEVEPFQNVCIVPREHQAYIWATEEEVRFGKAGNVDLKFVASSLRDAILEGFRQRRETDIQ
jgi:8-oxo-dGTP pyrophosphatase MutT (NUDIX family)